ncbi:MAG TPA: bifunctional aspartate kinase/homoserine dehydrogenase I [Cyclobacteriaceae bacterium]|nr:bifunctional aspartate kinase/homoserine dehydrogenase I [Cyclobacteriaceae bacterium]
MKVLKFGGSSVANPERIESVIKIIDPYRTEDVAVVFSAFGGVTDALIEVSQHALLGDTDYKLALAQIENRHLEVVRNLIGIRKQGSILAQVKIRINELEDVLNGVYLVKERTPRTLDYIMSFGERLSAYIINEILKDRGIASEFLDARSVIRTDNNFGSARVDFEETNRNIRQYFEEHRDLQVITGFVATSESGETTTLGRSGSDYTAAIFAGALQAETLEIWTDVSGMMTADPRMVKKAFTVPQLSYEEAMELSHFGAKVVFPATMQPAMAGKIPIRIKNTFDPDAEGTVISADVTNGKLIKGVSSMNGISVINVTGSGLVGVVGVSKRLFGTLADEKINVILISQASSEHSICFAIESKYSLRARHAIEKEFQYEIEKEEMERVIVEKDFSILAVVGEGMKHNPGTSGRMFSALGKNGVNVYAIAQGSSELNISSVVKEVDISKALNALHEAFFLSDRKVLNVFLVGTGLIGNTLLQMIADHYDKLSEENLLEINVSGVANSTRMLFDEDGLDLSTAVEAMKSRGEPMSMESFTERMFSLNLPNSIFVDCTSSEEVTNYYESVLVANVSIVTPNKKANSGSLANYRLLKSTAFKRGVKFLYETNVGAGLPVINTMNDLILSGDKVISIEAVLSGTLNYIFSSFVEGRRFSEVVLEAKVNGFTEPDPRDDLNGMDVARKILILAREAGWDLEPDDITVENLVPPSCRGDISVDEFFIALAAHDNDFEKMRGESAARGEKLRYMAVLKEGKVKIGLASVDNQHPFYSLSGSDNIILLTTERYHERPMVIRGPGAGAAVTAAGVFADIIRIGHYAK